jgi:hypothetical protein
MVQIDAQFGYDAAKGELVPVGSGSGSLDVVPVVRAMLFNYDDWFFSLTPTEYCFVLWDVSGVPTADPDFKDFWWSIDLVGVPITFDKSGDCEGMLGMFALTRGKDRLEDFVDRLQFGYGIHSVDDADAGVISDWELFWPKYGFDKTFGVDWDDFVPYTAVGAFNMAGLSPIDADLVPAYQVDETTWEVSVDSAGRPTWLDISGETSAPTAYYEGFVMSIRHEALDQAATTR